MGKKRSTKLVVEVVDAHDLMPKDGEGSASAFVEVDFANQLSRTNTIPKNLNPVWNQKLVFDFDETKNRNFRYIEVSVYNERRPFPGRSFLGRVVIPCTNIVRKGEEVYQQFQLEKKSLFSSVKGEIGLKIYISPEFETQSPSPPSSLSQSPSHNQARKSSNRPSGTVLHYSPPDTTLPEKTESPSSASLPQSPSHLQAQKPSPRPSSIGTTDPFPSTTVSERTESTTPSCSLPQSPQASQTQNFQQPPPRIVLRNRTTLSGTTSVNTNKTAAPLDKTGETNFYPPRIIQPQAGREIPSFPESEDISSPTSVSESSGEVPAEVFDTNIREAVETTHYVHKHQALEQPAIFMERRPQVVPSTRHHGNPHGHMSDQEDYELKDTNPQIGNRWPNVRGYGGRGWFSGEKYASTHDLVEQMYYLYVRVVKAKSLQQNSITGGCDPYVEVKLGNYRGRTRHYEKKMHPEWNQVFAFSKDRIQSSVLEVFVKDKEMFGRDDYLGRVLFDLNEIPTRVPPDSPLAPQWYRLEDRHGEGKVRGEIMLAVWMGTQADEAFPEAWHSDTTSVIGESVLNTRSKVYVSPKLWYLRVNIIEAQDVLPNDKFRSPEVFVKAQVGNQVLKTRICPTPTANPFWNEDLVFVAAEPFEEQLLITVEDRVHPSKEEILGKIGLPLTEFEKRLDHRPVLSRWFNLEKYGFGVLEADRRRELKFSSRIHLRVCLEGGYHVLDESTMYTSDQRPTARQLWKQPIGVLEVGILGAQGLLPMKMKDGRGTTDAYCVSKYGQKWVRTRTILNTFSPKWNEQYTWEVYDPCTVITFGVFDNWQLGGGEKPNGGSATRDSRIGKVRIRLSTLEANRIYTNSYPLLVLHPQGVKKMGELQLAVRFTILSLANMIYIYKQPLLPKMHYLHPFTVNQVDNLRYQAMNIVAMRLGRAEPPLRKEIVEYMLDVDSHMWSMRRSKANFFRIMSLSSGMISFNKWFGDVCNWKNPITSVLVHILFLILIWYPELILPTLFLYMFLIGIWNYRRRPRHPPHMDPKLSWAEVVHPDELDEEFDTFPTSRPNDTIRMRYDRLRSVAGRIQTVAGDIATQGERFQSLLSWRDPRATSLFIMFCLCTAVMLYVTPFRVVALVSGLYYLRHPRFRSKLPSVPSNFFKRLPARTDSLL